MGHATSIKNRISEADGYDPHKSPQEYQKRVAFLKCNFNSAFDYFIHND